ncbi:hypothetical protein JAB5_50260 [Janthinobacterium sp. HH103]|nr:hypothetical protein [Janthinobacterium sp. HH103]OEZ68276.1 hypothetical protein JAB5_50260 [Janthinobacterium sp. HH103]
MAISWKSDGKDASGYVNSLISEIKKYLSFNEDGAVSIRMGTFEFLADALYGFVDHKYPLNAEFLFRKFENSIREAYKDGKGNIDGAKILRIFEKDCSSALQKKNEFFLVTSINFSTSENPEGRIIDGCEISFHKKIPVIYKRHRADLIKEIQNKLKVKRDNFGYTYMVIKVIAPEHLTAFASAMRVFDIYRGLWQIYFSKKISFSLSEAGIRYNSDCILKPGNLHTLHLPDGRRAADCYWTEDFINSSPPVNIIDFQKIDDLTGEAIGKLGKAERPYFELCTKALINYVLAISKNDAEARFLSLWLCLEFVTNSDNADGIIKRLIFFFADRDVEKAILRSLRQARNSHVHAGVVPLNINMKNFRLCFFVDAM